MSNMIYTNDNSDDDYLLGKDDILTSIRYKLTLFACVICVIVFGSTASILIPICTIYIPSSYAIVLISTVEIAIFFAFVLIFIYIKIDPYIFNVDDFSSKIVLIFAGIFCSLMVIAKIYASNPNRTSPIMQSTLVSTTIVFTVIFSKILLKKEITYKWICIGLSILALIGSVLLPLIYELLNSHISGEFKWILCYQFGVICRGLYTTLQEKYFLVTNDFTTCNKIKLLFYVSIIQLICVIPGYGFEYILSNSTNPGIELLNSTKIIFTVPIAALTFHGFIFSYILYLGFSIWLNTISSNFVMMASVVITPAVTIFFVIFKNIVTSIEFPLYIIIPSLISSLISTVLWIYGENNTRVIIE